MKLSHAMAPLMLAFVAAACSDSTGPTGSNDLRGPSLALVTPPSGPDPLGESIVVCKVGGEGSYDFTYTGVNNNTQAAINGGFSLNPGECWNIGFFGGAGVTLSITEVPRDGHNVVGITVDQLNGADQNVTGTNTVSGVVGAGNPRESALVTFTNEVSSDPEEEGTEGCTPGYWKNHADSWPGTGYTTGQTAGSVFNLGGFPSVGSWTLLEALGGGGGGGTLGAAKILVRAATAALLNAGSAGVDYPWTTADIVADVNAALASNDRAAMLALAAELDADNNLGCPLN